MNQHMQNLLIGAIDINVTLELYFLYLGTVISKELYFKDFTL